jgi:hypothetical protein
VRPIRNTASLAQEGEGAATRFALAGFGDGILQIDDERVGAAGECLGEFSRAVGGHEKQRAHPSRAAGA